LTQILPKAAIQIINDEVSKNTHLDQQCFRALPAISLHRCGCQWANREKITGVLDYLAARGNSSSRSLSTSGGDKVSRLVGDHGHEEGLGQSNDTGLRAGDRWDQAGKAAVGCNRAAGQADGAEGDQEQAGEHNQTLAGAVEGIEFIG
jgi:hypothetical protein